MPGYRLLMNGGRRPVGWLALACLLLVAGCNTPEYRTAENICRAEWTQQLPPDFQLRPVNRVRYEDVPDGEEECTTETIRDDSDPDKVVVKTKEVCKQGTKQKEVNYISVETIDVNRPERDARIQDCAARACLLSHGNAACKTPE